MTSSQPFPEQQSQNPEIVDFKNIVKCPKKIELPEKFKLPAKRRFELTEKAKRESCPPAKPR